MKGIKVLLKDAQKVKQKLIELNNLNPDFKVKKDSKYIYFPVNFEFNDFEIIDFEFEKSKTKIPNLKELLKNDLTEVELEHLKTSYDTIGCIAILEIEKELQNKADLIAKALLASNKTIKTILAKQDKHEGPFRTKKLKFILGEDTKETIHKENGVLIKVDVEEVYFSPRLSNDRKRIASLVFKNEFVIVVGSGCGPYPLVLSKHSKAKRIIGIEFNPKGHEFALENKRLNKIKNVDFVLGDAKIELQKYENIDRIILATPDNSNDFLKTAFKVIKKKGFIHANYFSKEEDFEKLISDIKNVALSENLNVDVKIVKNGQHAPYVFRVSADIQIL